VGKLIKFDATAEKPEGYILDLHMFPNTKFGVFEDKPREKKDAPPTAEKTEEYTGKDIDPEDIPF